MTTPHEHVLNAKAKLLWAANGEFSAAVKPMEAAALLSYIQSLETPTGTVDRRTHPDAGRIVAMNGDGAMYTLNPYYGHEEQSKAGFNGEDDEQFEGHPA